MRRNTQRALLFTLICAAVLLAAPQAHAADSITHRFIQEVPGRNGQPTLADFWDRRATFVIDVTNTGLPMGESETMQLRSGELWSYVHANSGAGVVDSCGAPTPFPGCVVIYRSQDRGRSFTLQEKRCLIPCKSCPCSESVDHINQQQYPRIGFDPAHPDDGVWMAYEHGAQIFVRRSRDGLIWSAARRLPGTGVQPRSGRCIGASIVGAHPFTDEGVGCLLGGPPGLFVEDKRVHVFMAQGQSPGNLACMVGTPKLQAERFKLCRANPLVSGAPIYGDTQAKGPAQNAYFDFRTLSAAEVMRVGARYYAFYEGIRGPSARDFGDTQFGIGLARSATGKIDGPWEKFSGNPVIVDLPGNIGLGHTDVIVIDGKTFLYTSLDGWVRSRLVLIWLNAASN